MALAVRGARINADFFPNVLHYHLRGHIESADCSLDATAARFAAAAGRSGQMVDEQCRQRQRVLFSRYAFKAGARILKPLLQMRSGCSGTLQECNGILEGAVTGQRVYLRQVCS